jgi:hypothetical protein
MLGVSAVKLTVQVELSVLVVSGVRGRGWG